MSPACSCRRSLASRWTPARSRGGSVIAVCGARGGVGTTTVAVNLALQLTAATRGHVALLDLHLRQGTTALMLGVKPVGGLRIALEQPERADALFLDRVAVEINERLRLIAAEESLDGTPSPTPDGMRRVLDLLRRRFNYIVMDLPMPATLAEMQALRAARHLLVVMAPDLAGIRDADRLRQLAAGLGTSHTTIVLNRLGMPGGLKMPLIEQGLGGKPTVQIPELGKQLGRAANLGKPALGECAAFRKAMALLAQEVSGARRKPAVARRRPVAPRPDAGPMKPFGRRLERSGSGRDRRTTASRAPPWRRRMSASSFGCAPRSWNSSIRLPSPRCRRTSCAPSWSR